MAKEIKRLYAFIAHNKNLEEGIVAHVAGKEFAPLVFSDFEIAQKFKPLAQNAANISDVSISLCVFEKKECLEFLEPVRSDVTI